MQLLIGLSFALFDRTIARKFSVVDEAEIKTEPGACLCGSSEESSFMICCDHCGVWYHGSCLQVIFNCCFNKRCLRSIQVCHMLITSSISIYKRYR